METLNLPLTLHEGFPEGYSEIEDQKFLVTEQKAHSYLHRNDRVPCADNS